MQRNVETGQEQTRARMCGVRFSHAGACLLLALFDVALQCGMTVGLGGISSDLLERRANGR